MMARPNLLGSAMNFAHLLGGRPVDDKGTAKATPAAAEKENDDEDEKKNRRDEEDKDDKKRRDEDEDDKEKRRDEEDEDEPSDDDDDKKDTKATAARGRERARCAAIFGSKHAAARPDMAAYFAFGTDLSRREACHALAAVAAGQPVPQAAVPRAGLRGRMEGQASPVLGDGGASGPALDTPQGLARQMLASAGIPAPK